MGMFTGGDQRESDYYREQEEEQDRGLYEYYKCPNCGKLIRKIDNHICDIKESNII